MSSASTAECRLDADAGSYQWSFRVIDAFGGATAWKRYSTGPAADFEIQWQGSSGPAGCLKSSAGAASAWALIVMTMLAMAARRI